jgi:hypothetical protein
VNPRAQVTDVLAPYEVVATTGAFNLYVAAAAAGSLGGGLDLLPHRSFAELDQRLRGAHPDLIVVPAVATGGRHGQPARGRGLAGAPTPGGTTTILSVCNVAEAGL